MKRTFIKVEFKGEHDKCSGEGGVVGFVGGYFK